MPPAAPDAPPPLTRTRVPARLFVAAGLAVALVAALIPLRHELSLQSLAAREQLLRDYRRSHPAAVYCGSLLLYVAVTALSIPAATVLTVTYAWLFGFWRALVIVSFAAAAGATLAFLLSRYLFRDLVQRRFGDRLARFNEALRRDGPFYLFSLRLTPLVPFFVVNLVMGLTPLRARTFWWVSQLGMLPVSAVWAWAGASVPSLGEIAATIERDGPASLVSWRLLASLFLIGLLPLAARLVARRLQRPR